MKEKKPGFGRAALGAVLCFGLIFILARVHGGDTKPRPELKVETFSLVHAIGNNEHVSATGLSYGECNRRKADLKAAATALGTYNEATGYGSIVCWPENLK